MMKPGKTVKQLAAEWDVSPPRIYQLISSGKLRYISNGKVDYEHAQAFRKRQVSDHPTRTQFTEHSNGGGAPSPKKILTYVARERRAKMEDDDDLLALPDDDDDMLALPEPVAPIVVPEPTSPEYEEQLRRNQRMNEIKLLLAEEALKAKQMKREHEQGLYVLRAEAHRNGVEAAKITGSVLTALPDQIAGIFASDPVQREEVRRKAEELVERALHTISQRLDGFARGESSDAV